MNTIIDLNVASNANVNNQSSYAISFGTNVGNTTINSDAYDTHALAKQTPLNSVSNAVRDILIDVQFPSYPSAGSVAYTGPYGNIGVQRINNTLWRVTGIRDVNRYNEAFANVRVSDTGVSNAYSYTTLVQDQYGNNRNWSTQVNVRALPVMLSTGPVLFNEDTLSNITQLSFTANANSTANYVLTSTIRNQSGEVSNTTTSGNTVTITGNIATITTAVSGGNLKFLPRPDLAANLANALNFQLSINNNLISQANASVEVGNVSNEYSLTTLVNYSEDVTANMTSSIIDVDPDPISYTVTWQQTEPAVIDNAGQFLANSVGAGWGNVLTITSSKAAINARSVAFTPPADYTGNITLTYTQTKLGRDGVVYMQANAVPVSLTNTATHNEYSILGGTGNLSYAGLVNNSLAYTVTDLAADSTYNISFNATGNASTSTGVWVVNAANVGTVGSNLSLTGLTKAQINSANISWYPVNDIDTATPVQFAFSQTKLAPDGKQYVQASNVVLTFSAAPVANVISGITQYYNSRSSWRNYNAVGNVVTSYQSPIPNPVNEYVPVVVDGPIAPETTEGNPVYTVTLTQTTPNVGNIELRGMFAGNSSEFNPNAPIANSITITGNRAAVNNRFVVYSGNTAITNNNVAYTPPAGYTGNIDMTYTQTKTVGNVTIMQANAVPFTMEIVDAAFYTGVKAPAATPLTVSDSGYTGLNQTWTFEDGGGIPPANPFTMYNYQMYIEVSTGVIYALSGGPSPTVTNYGSSVWLSSENAVTDTPQWTVADPWVGNTSTQTSFGVSIGKVRHLLLNKCLGAGSPPSDQDMRWRAYTQSGTGNITVSMYRIDPLVSIYDYYGNVPTAARKLVNSVTTVVTFNDNESPTGS